MSKASTFAKAGSKYLGRPYSEMDCQAFVEKCLKDAGISLDLPGSNAWYRKMTWVGSPEDCKKKFGGIPQGAFLFILANDGGEKERGYYDGKGNASHIGIYTAMTGQQMVDDAMAHGNTKAVNYNFGDGAIHSSSSRGAVCTSKFQGKTIPNGGWNKVGLWDQLKYGEPYDSILSGKPSGGGDDPEPDPEPEPSGTETATVFSDNGGSVKLRAKPSTDCSMYWDIPFGATMEVDDHESDWCHGTACDVHGLQHTGYMMTKFLIFGEYVPGDDEQTDTGIDPNMILVQRSILEDIYSELGKILGIRG